MNMRPKTRGRFLADYLRRSRDRIVELHNSSSWHRYGIALDETIRWTTGIAPEYMIGVGSTVSIVMHVRFAPKADK